MRNLRNLPLRGPGRCDGASYFPPVNRVTSPLSCQGHPRRPAHGPFSVISGRRPSCPATGLEETLVAFSLPTS